MISDKCMALMFTSHMIKTTSCWEIWMIIVLSAEKIYYHQSPSYVNLKDRIVNPSIFMQHYYVIVK